MRSSPPCPAISLTVSPASAKVIYAFHRADAFFVPYSGLLSMLRSVERLSSLTGETGSTFCDRVVTSDDGLFAVRPWWTSFPSEET